ncbi:MAG: glycosyltransferase [Roseomonas sp.]|nr:glycosyltransferase [Roseomonas sp.]MCA3327738.1 glycosyltransferase [Roseomonas sp.]MCA3331240.1 glycosyltransferase [Roseomonas sp.]MCA3334762.1 glycosyltransferase [Roseomonas sp.]MCA3348155.1 glycosyltransferase [Roseomonas sp.]
MHWPAELAGLNTVAALARVCVVTVAYNSAAALRGMLGSLPPGLGAIVVDNASTDDSAAVAEGAGARVIRNGANLGFGAGCNIGMDAAATEFVLLANPDTRLDGAAIARLVAAADAFPDAAILAPMLCDETGARVRSWDVEQLHRRLLERKRDAEPWPEGPLCAEFLSGACLLLRASDALRFDEAFFLFYEDDAICAAARAKGRALVLVPDAVMQHAGGGSSAPSQALSAFKARHMAWSRLHYMALMRGDDAARREAWARVWHHASKALGHGLTLRFEKLRADMAGLGGTVAWLRGKRA